MRTGKGLLDCHTHVVPSLDDGARSVEEGLELCRMALEAGTTTLFATPHVHAGWDTYPWTPEREQIYEVALAEMRDVVAGWGLDLRRGFEIFPTEVREDDVVAFGLEGTRGVLIEFPGEWLTTFPDPLDSVALASERAENEGLLPVLAHPERSAAARGARHVLAEFVRRGWILCLNAPSLLGGHGRAAEQSAWELLADGLVGVVASDGHRRSRPPVLDGAYEEVAARLGARLARDVFAGSALRLSIGSA